MSPTPVRRAVAHVLVPVVLGLASIGSAQAGLLFTSIGSNESDLSVRAIDQLGGADVTDSVDIAAGTATPLAGSLVADTSGFGAASARSQLDYQFGSGGFSFDFTARSGGNPNGGDGSANFSTEVIFEVTENTTFSFSATASGNSNSGAAASGSLFGTFFHAFVAEIFTTNQQSGSNAPTYLLEADGSAPAAINATTGSFSGTLETGKTYHLVFNGGASSDFTPVTGADYAASVSLVLGSGGSASPVPGPATVVLVLLALPALLAVRRRRS